MSEAVSENAQNEEVEKSSIKPEIQTLKVGLIMPISNTEGYPLQMSTNLCTKTLT